jgi:periplasmic protein TonB
MFKIISISHCSLIITATAQCQITPIDSTSTTVYPHAGTDDKVFARVEQEAVFPGGFTAWKKYLEKNLQNDIAVKNGAPKGIYNVIAKFIVTKEGTITEVTTETNNGYGMEKEVTRVIKNGPKWKPAMQNNRPVNAYRRQPFTFVVAKD